MNFFLVTFVVGVLSSKSLVNSSPIISTEDPSIWSIRTFIDDFLFGPIAATESSVYEFTADDYELKDLLVKCVDIGDWKLFDEMLRLDVKDWCRIPEIEDLIEALVCGPSEIIYEMFLRDERIRKDDRIIKDNCRNFFHHENGLTRIAVAFDSGVFEAICAGYERAEEIFRINERVPIEWYYQTIPVKCKSETQLMKFVAKNPFIPVQVLEYLVNETLVPLNPIEFSSMPLKISLHALTDVYGNHQLRWILMNSSRYADWIGKSNTKTDLIAQQFIKRGIEL